MELTFLGLHDISLFSICAVILLLFLAITSFTYNKLTSESSHWPEIYLDEKTAPHPPKDDSGYESSDDEDFDGLGHLRKALRMVDDTFDPRASSARRSTDDFQVFAEFASTSQRRAMQRASQEG